MWTVSVDNSSGKFGQVREERKYVTVKVESESRKKTDR